MFRDVKFALAVTIPNHSITIGNQEKRQSATKTKRWNCLRIFLESISHSSSHISLKWRWVFMGKNNSSWPAGLAWEQRHDALHDTNSSHEWLQVALLSRLLGDREEWFGTFVIFERPECAVVVRQLGLTAQQRLVLVHLLLHLHTNDQTAWE